MQVKSIQGLPNFFARNLQVDGEFTFSGSDT